MQSQIIRVEHLLHLWLLSLAGLEVVAQLEGIWLAISLADKRFALPSSYAIGKLNLQSSPKSPNHARETRISTLIASPKEEEIAATSPSNENIRNNQNLFHHWPKIYANLIGCFLSFRDNFFLVFRWSPVSPKKSKKNFADLRFGIAKAPTFCVFTDKTTKV